MNRKGQIGVGTLMITFISVIVGVILFTAIAQQVGTTTNTVTLSNESFTSGAEGASVYITTYRAISSPIIYNAIGTLVPAANYTITNNVVTDGALSIEIATGAVNDYAGQVWNISGTVQPLTYIPGSGGRAVAGLIAIFFAIAIVVVALTPTLSSKLLDAIGR